LAEHKKSISQPEAKKPANPWIWIIVVVLLVLGCCITAVVGGGLIYLRNQDLAWQDVLPSGLEEPQVVPEVSINTPVPQKPEQPPIKQVETEVPINTPVPEETVQPTPQVETEEPQNELPSETILAITSSGIWVVDAQTGEAAQISHDPLDAPWDLNDGMSPDKKFFAFITGFGGASVNPMLVVLDIENQTSILQLELTGPIIQPGTMGIHGDPTFEAFGAIQSYGSFAWSPDGTRLAFVAARDGDSADVYLFNQSDNSVTRLTDEAGHAAALNWSPDGQLLQYLSIHTFGTGAGAAMEGLWVYDFQVKQAQLLENLDSNGEDFLGWTDNSHFLIASWGRMCESYNLRLVNAARLLSQVIVDGCFTGIAYDPDQKHGMFAVTDFNTENCSCGQPLDAGLMLFGEGVGYPVAGDFGYKKFELLNAYTVRFIPQGNLFLIFGDDGQPFIFNDQLSNMDIPAEVSGFTPYASPTGDYWAWSSRAQSGLWITERNMNPVEVSRLFTGIPFWSQDGQTIYFYENNRLFSASAPQFSTATLVVEISEDILGLVK
jgi:WD40 repeat protein